MADQALPTAITSWMQNLDWGMHHLRWHAERQWDLQTPAVQAQLAAQGWSRAARQEGSPGNGWDFLLMHRAMIQILKQQFPANSSLFLGWATPPTNPNDVNDPVPNSAPFSPSMLNAINRLSTNLASFTTEDELGLYIETRLRPAPGNPTNVSPDASTGIHNYIHNRFSDDSSPINLGDPSVNLENARFWKLHGWIDGVWSAFRQLKGLSDTAPAYVSALEAEKNAMLHTGGHHPLAMSAPMRAARVANSRVALESMSSEVRRPFRESTARRVQRLVTSTPTITTREELVEYLQTAIQVEHGTLPLYLTAMWSLKDDSGDHYGILRGIALQEMLHLGIVCNLLKAIGERPLIAPPMATIPVFPGQLPGLDLSDVMSGDISLESFSTFDGDPKSRIKLFMRIERPVDGDIDPQIAAHAARLRAMVPKFHTIGEFYDVILQGIKTLAEKPQPEITFAGTGQIGADWFAELTPITTKDEAVKQITLIQTQGEGTSSSQASGSSSQELAHYYRFKQIVEEKKYNWSSGQPVLDPALVFPFPAQDRIRQFTPAPLGGHPQSATFDGAYSNMLNSLQRAWDDHPDALNDAISFMFEMTTAATALMESGYGPNFHYVSAPLTPGPRSRRIATRATIRNLAASRAETTAAPAAAVVSVPGYARIRQILDEAVNGENFGAHGPFWRSLTRDQFVAKSIFGRALLQQNPDGTFDPQESNLVKALEGRAPFGKDLTPRPAGAIFNRMPDGFPAVPQTKIDEIRTWIGAGCPDVPPAAASIVDSASPATMSIDDYVRFWRALDDVAMFEATPQVQADIGVFFNAADNWLSFAKDPSLEATWIASITASGTADAIRRLEQLQRETILQSFGTPARQEDLLSCWEKFGDDSLPDDPLRPTDVRHSMNGEIMWFFWCAFTDAATRLSATDAAIPLDFWQAIARCVLLGLLNDGVFRGRFPVQGFPNTNAGKQAMRLHATTLPATSLGAELRTRFVDTGF